MITKIKNGRLILPDRVETEACLYYEYDRITAVTQEPLAFDEEIDAAGQYVSPGFIDLHVHGGGGDDCMDGGTAPILGTAAMHLKHGTTALLPTTLACSTGVLLEFLEDLKTVMTAGQSESRILGAHLEGPYFSLAQCGAQNPDYIKAPDPAEYEMLIRQYGSIIRRWSFAPELAGSTEFCRRLTESQILPSVAHSDAVLEDVQRVYDEGCRMVTHLYSGMSTITRRGGFRYLGVVEAAYLLEDITAEIIADGCHLPPPLLKLIVKHLGTAHICLVTDAMRGAGMPEGPSMLGRKGESVPCIIEEGVAKMTDRSGFAGSVATADRLVRTMVQKAGLSVPEAVQMMTVNPARVLGRKDLGVLGKGCLADIVMFDDDITISHVIAGGKQIAL